MKCDYLQEKTGCNIFLILGAYCKRTASFVHYCKEQISSLIAQCIIF